MSKAIWIDSYDVHTERDSDVGFLVQTGHILRGRVRYHLSTRPAHTNLSHEPRLYGWCGTTNDIAKYGKGLATVARRAKNGRVCLRRVEATPEILEELGWPELG